MKLAFDRIIGVVLILASVAGLILSMLGIVEMWRLRRTMTSGLLESIELLDTTLQATTDGLTVVDESLSKATLDVYALGNTLQTTGQAIHDTNPLLDELTRLVSEDLPDAILTTQTALTSAQASARLIESTLKIVTAIPLLPLEPYDPPVPLDVALGNVSTSLDPIPDSLSAMEQSMTTSQGNLLLIEAEFNIMARHIGEINASLTEARTVVAQYQGVVDEVHVQVLELQTNLPKWMGALTWFVTLVLLWLAVTQVGLLMQGMEMLGYRLGADHRD